MGGDHIDYEGKLWPKPERREAILESSIEELLNDAARTLDNMIYFAQGHDACGPYAIEEAGAVLTRLRAALIRARM